MLKYIVVLAALGTGVVFADVKIQRNLLGSGIQNEAMTADVATQVGDYGVYHVPQYMPGHPTAATIWPRVVEVKCQNDLCEGYENTPALGRGEYLFFKPVNTVAAVAIPVVVPAPVVMPPREIQKQIRQ
ncbi:MAG: hypothetical protein ABIR13_00675 [Polaromonas sp.]